MTEFAPVPPESVSSSAGAAPATPATPRTYADWYERVYPYLTGSGLWLRGDEPGRIDPSAFDTSDYRILFTRLSTWNDTVESFTHRLLYQIARSIDGVFPDYAFLPPWEDLPIFKADSVPWMLGIHTKRDALSFDAIGISNSIMQELVNLPPMLAASGIPIGKKERMARPDVPLIILGGANAIHTSLIMVPNSPVDVIFAGESVELITDIFRRCAEGKRRGLTKLQILDELDTIDGCILPDRPRATQKIHAKCPGSTSLMIGAPQPLSVDTAGTGVLQISEGCQNFCSFCSESYVRKPYREESTEVLMRDARAMKKANGLQKIDLFSFNFASYHNFYPLVESLVELYPEIGLKSQRLDTIATDAQLLPLLHALGKSKLTVGIEGISERLRTYLHKNLTRNMILRGFEAIATAPVREVKLFFILTGLETSDDFNELSNLAADFKRMMERAGRGPRLVFSATALVRFPWTPLEWEAAPFYKDVEALSERFEKTVTNAGFEARMAAPASEYWVSQIFARARNPGVYDAVLRAQELTNFLYYSNMTGRFAARLRDELVAGGLDPDECLAPLPMDDDSAPWVYLGSGLKRDFLKIKAREAREFTESPLKLVQKTATVTARGAVYVPLYERARKINDERRRTMTLLPLNVDILPRLKGVPRSLAGSLLAAAFLNEWDDLVPHYLGYESSKWGKDWDNPTITGRDIITLRWTADGAALLRTRLTDAEAIAKLNARLAPRLALALEPFAAASEKVILEVTSPYKFDGAAYCAGLHIKHTLRKPEPTLSVFDFTPQALKKSPVKSMSCRATETGCIVTISVDAAFDAQSFLRHAFALPSKLDWVRLDAVARNA